MRKTCNKYYFTYEGETEGWYLEHLSKLINDENSATHRVSLNKTKSIAPLDYVKTKTLLQETEIYQIVDFEGSEGEFSSRFKALLADMKLAPTINTNAHFNLAYNNLTFELWMVLHKVDCNPPKTNRDDYLQDINRAFEEKFENPKSYKREKNFKRCLKKITLNDVKDAICRAKAIMKARNFQHKPQQYNGYCYYEENPSLMIWQPIEKILQDCDLLH